LKPHLIVTVLTRASYMIFKRFLHMLLN